MDDLGGVKIGDFGVARVMAPAGVMTAETGTYRCALCLQAWRRPCWAGAPGAWGLLLPGVGLPPACAWRTQNWHVQPPHNWPPRRLQTLLRATRVGLKHVRAREAKRTWQVDGARGDRAQGIQGEGGRVLLRHHAVGAAHGARAVRGDDPPAGRPTRCRRQPLPLLWLPAWAGYPCSWPPPAAAARHAPEQRRGKARPRLPTAAQGGQPLQAAVGVVQKGLRPSLPASLPPNVAHILRACWSRNPEERPSFAALKVRPARRAPAARARCPALLPCPAMRCAGASCLASARLPAAAAAGCSSCGGPAAGPRVLRGAPGGCRSSARRSGRQRSARRRRRPGAAAAAAACSQSCART